MLRIFEAKWVRLMALRGLTVALVVGLLAPAAPAQQAGQSGQAGQQQNDWLCARSYGDPHIVTYDDYRYSFQTVGEYVLSQSKNGEVLVQARQAEVPDQAISLNSAAAVKVGNHRVGIYAQNAPDGRTELWIDGQPADLSAGPLTFPEGGTVTAMGDGTTEIILPTGEKVSVKGISVNDTDFLNLDVCVPRNQQGNLQGLLGNYNGDANDDLQGRDGRVVPSQDAYAPVSQLVNQVIDIPLPLNDLQTAFFGQLYRQFGDSWRIAQAESLFDYAPGESTLSFTNQAFPDRFPSLVGVSSDRIQAATETCRSTGVAEADIEGCVFDVAATGESGFAQAALNAVSEVVVDRVQEEVSDRIQEAIPFSIPGGFRF